MNHGLKLTPKMINDLAEGYQSGKTTSQLAEEFSISKATICRALRKMGIEPERKDNMFTVKEVDKEQQDAIILDFRAGLKVKDLSRKYGYSYPVLVRILEENDLYTKKPAPVKNPLNVTKVIKVNENKVRRFLSLQEQTDLCEKYVDGPYSKIELAAEYQVNIDTVSAVLRRNNALVKRYISDEILDLICEDYKNGTTVHSISSVYNQSPETIKYWLTKRELLDNLKDDGTDVPEKKLTTAELRKKAKNLSPDMLEILEDIARDPTAGVRNRITAAVAIIERAHGKPREELEEEKDTESATDKILKLLPSTVKKDFGTK